MKIFPINHQSWQVDWFWCHFFSLILGSCLLCSQTWRCISCFITWNVTTTKFWYSVQENASRDIWESLKILVYQLQTNGVNVEQLNSRTRKSVTKERMSDNFNIHFRQFLKGNRRCEEPDLSIESSYIHCAYYPDWPCYLGGGKCDICER